MTAKWTPRLKGTQGLPAGLIDDQLIQYRLAGDPNTYHDEAGNLMWADGPGCIAEYRMLVPAPAVPEPAPQGGAAPKPHSHYFKDVAGLAQVDVYRVLVLFGVSDPALAHAVKKLLVAGGRGAGKGITRDVQEAIDSLQRWQEMRDEDTPPLPHA